MHSIISTLFLLSSLALYANGVGLNRPGRKLPLAKRTHRIPRTLQQPSFYKRESNDISPFEKRGTLETRQDTCPAGTASCPSGGCCDGSCCGNGCCPAGYNCQFVGTTPGCCPTATTCSNQISGCADSGYVECTGLDFCCPAGQACSLDAAGNDQCNGITVGNGNGNTTPPPSDSSGPASLSISSTPTISSIPTPDAGGDTSPTFESITPTAPPGTLPVTASNSLTTTTTKGNTGNTSSSSAASTRFEADRMGVGAMVLAIFGGIMCWNVDSCP